MQYDVKFEGGRFDGECGPVMPGVVPPMALYLAEEPNGDCINGIGYYVVPMPGSEMYLRAKLDTDAEVAVYRSEHLTDPFGMRAEREHEPVTA